MCTHQCLTPVTSPQYAPPYTGWGPGERCSDIRGTVNLDCSRQLCYMSETRVYSNHVLHALRSSSDDVAVHGCQLPCTTKPYKDAQNRLFWRGKTGLARTQLIVSWKALLPMLLLMRASGTGNWQSWATRPPGRSGVWKSLMRSTVTSTALPRGWGGCLSRRRGKRWTTEAFCTETAQSSLQSASRLVLCMWHRHACNQKAAHNNKKLAHNNSQRACNSWKPAHNSRTRASDNGKPFHVDRKHAHKDGKPAHAWSFKTTDSTVKDHEVRPLYPEAGLSNRGLQCAAG